MILYLNSGAIDAGMKTELPGGKKAIINLINNTDSWQQLHFVHDGSRAVLSEA